MVNAFQSKTIVFNNGEILTCEQAANLIEQEGQLTPGPFIHNSMRCAIAVLENHVTCQNCLKSEYCYHPQREKYIENIWFTVCLSAENDREIDDDMEKPKDRCSRIVTWLRK